MPDPDLIKILARELASKMAAIRTDEIAEAVFHEMLARASASTDSWQNTAKRLHVDLSRLVHILEL